MVVIYDASDVIEYSSRTLELSKSKQYRKIDPISPLHLQAYLPTDTRGVYLSAPARH